MLAKRNFMSGIPQWRDDGTGAALGQRLPNCQFRSDKLAVAFPAASAGVEGMVLMRAETWHTTCDESRRGGYRSWKCS
jgi:hypothetical protein